MNTLDEQIERAIQREDWPVAQRLLTEAVRKHPQDHWYLTRLSMAHYEQHEYSSALELARRAWTMAPECPLVSWDLACALDMTGHEREAISHWKRLLAKDVERLAQDECGEGVRWAKSLRNDCRYRIGLAYFDLGSDAIGRRWLAEHLTHRAPGLPSLYTKADVERALASPAATGSS